VDGLVRARGLPRICIYSSDQVNSNPVSAKCVYNRALGWESRVTVLIVRPCGNRIFDGGGLKAVTWQGSFGAVCFPTSLLAFISLLGSCCTSPNDIKASVAAGLVYLLAGITFQSLEGFCSYELLNSASRSNASPLCAESTACRNRHLKGRTCISPSVSNLEIHLTLVLGSPLRINSFLCPNFSPSGYCAKDIARN
jgi:hypothetical protein